MKADLSLHEADLMLRMNDFNWNRRECGRFACQFMNGILFDKSTTDLSKKLCNLKVTMEHCTAYEAGEKAYLPVKAGGYQDLLFIIYYSLSSMSFYLLLLLFSAQH